LLLVEVKDKVIVLGEKSKAVSGTGDMLVMCPSQVIIGGCLRISESKLGSQTERLARVCSSSVARSCLGEGGEGQDGGDESSG
jgi:hypothetical protein